MPLFTYIDASKGYPVDVMRVSAEDSTHADAIVLENGMLYGKRWSHLSRWSSMRIEPDDGTPYGSFHVFTMALPKPIPPPRPMTAENRIAAGLALAYAVWLAGRKICFYCGSGPEKHEGFVREHIHPRSKGGKATVPACTPCDKDKQNYTLDEFRRLRSVDKFFGENQVEISPLLRTLMEARLESGTQSSTGTISSA